jgi:hypothetical protein
MDGFEWFYHYQKELNGISNSELISKFNYQVNVGNTIKMGWTTSRASYLTAIHDQFIKIKIDCSEIGDKNSMSFKHHVVLVGKKLMTIHYN